MVDNPPWRSFHRDRLQCCSLSLFATACLSPSGLIFLELHGSRNLQPLRLDGSDRQSMAEGGEETPRVRVTSSMP